MKKLVLSALLAAAMTAGSSANAGGPVIIEEGNNEVIAEAPRSGFAVPLILGILVLAVVAGSGDGDEEPPKKP